MGRSKVSGFATSPSTTIFLRAYSLIKIETWGIDEELLEAIRQGGLRLIEGMSTHINHSDQRKGDRSILGDPKLTA